MLKQGKEEVKVEGSLRSSKRKKKDSLALALLKIEKIKKRRVAVATREEKIIRAFCLLPSHANTKKSKSKREKGFI